MKRLWRTLEVLAGVLFFAAAALVLALRYWLLPDIERYRPLIVERVAAAVGQPVKIGAIDAGWQGFRPQIHLSDVRIYDTEGREALLLPSVDNILSWRSLLHGELGLHSLAIDGPRLTVRRGADGRLVVAGMKLAPVAGSARRAGALFGDGDIQIRNAEIEWHDDKRGAPALALTQLNLRLRSDGEGYAVGLTARPPDGLGASLDLRAQLVGESLEDASGRVYAELGTTDLAAWRPWVDYPVALDRGQGALRLWATLEHGAVRTATADLALSGVVARLAPEAAPLELESLTGRLHARRTSEGYQLSARKLAVQPASGAALPPLDFQLAWKPSGGSLGVNALELEPMARIAEALPIPAELRRLLMQLQPRGQLADAKVEWRGPATAPERFNARTRFSELAIAPAGAAPGFAGLAGTIEATESHGRLWLQSRGAVLDLPRVFTEPRLALEALNAQVDWLLEGDALNVRIASASFANADAAGSAYGSYTRAGDGPGRIDLSASLTRADGAHVARYVPVVVGDKTREWLASGIVRGEADDVHLRLRGDLRDFPFADPAQGEFTVRAHVQKGTLQYAEGWPRIDDIDADLLFDRDGMQVVGRRGSILGARLENVRVAIAHFKTPRVDVAGEAEGDTAEFLKYVAASPVRGMARGATDTMSAAGRGRLRLRLELPLENLERSRVTGDYEFADNTIVLQPKLPPLEHAGGKLSFTDQGFAIDNVRARAFGGPVTVSGATQAGAMEVVARGDATVAGAAVLFDHPLRQQVTGGAPYVARLTWRDGSQRVVVESSLRGVASALPAPLDKAAADALPLRVEVAQRSGGARDRLLVSLGKIAAYEAHRRRDGEAMRVVRSGLALRPAPGQPVRLPDRPGLLVSGSLAALDADRWQALLAGGDARAQGAGSTAMSADLKLGRITLFGRSFNNVALRGGSDASGWSAVIDADEVAGKVSYRAKAGGQVVARLLHLTLPEANAASQGGGQLHPADLPPMDITVEQFALPGRDLGRMELVARRQDDDWLIERLAITNPDATLRGSGAWRGGAVPRSELEFSIDAADAGAMLERGGYGGLVSGGKAKLDGMVRWQGRLTAIDYPTLSGELQLHAEDGQFLEIDPGIGKLISLMSLQALPRRITLDFRDVFSKGFRFDRIDATSHVDNGVMQIGEFRMRGATADVAMSGAVDVARETQDLRVRVVPSLGGTASTAVAIVNPVAGIAAAIAQKALKDPLGQIFAHDFSVSGSWADPKVTQIVKLVTPNEVATP